MTNTNNLQVDTFGTLHTTASCEEFHGPALGTVPSTSEAARMGIHCADCED